MDKLPYVFDLLYDIKHLEEVEIIARGEASHSDADPYELLNLFEKEGLEIPKCLLPFKSKKPPYTFKQLEAAIYEYMQSGDQRGPKETLIKNFINGYAPYA